MASRAGIVMPISSYFIVIFVSVVEVGGWG